MQIWRRTNMRLIVFLQIVADGKDLPKKIKYKNSVFELDSREMTYIAWSGHYGAYLLEKCNILDKKDLNAEIEVLDDQTV